MNKNWLKFGVISVVIVGVLGWLAGGGIQETNTYYKTIKEVAQMGDQAQVDAAIAKAQEIANAAKTLADVFNPTPAP